MQREVRRAQFKRAVASALGTKLDAGEPVRIAALAELAVELHNTSEHHFQTNFRASNEWVREFLCDYGFRRKTIGLRCSTLLERAPPSAPSLPAAPDHTESVYATPEQVPPDFAAPATGRTSYLLRGSSAEPASAPAHALQQPIEGRLAAQLVEQRRLAYIESAMLAPEIVFQTSIYVDIGLKLGAVSEAIQLLHGGRLSGHGTSLVVMKADTTCFEMAARRGVFPGSDGCIEVVNAEPFPSTTRLHRTPGKMCTIIDLVKAALVRERVPLCAVDAWSVSATRS